MWFYSSTAVHLFCLHAEDQHLYACNLLFGGKKFYIDICCVKYLFYLKEPKYWVFPKMQPDNGHPSFASVLQKLFDKTESIYAPFSKRIHYIFSYIFLI